MAKSYHHGDLKAAAIKKTVEIIHKKGDVDFTLREIAQSLKVSHAAIYRHFKSKQDLLSHIAEEGFSFLVADFENIPNAARPSRNRLLSLGKTYIDFALRSPGHYRCMFHNELRCAEEQRPELEDIALKAFQYLEDSIQSGIKDGLFRKEAAEATARSIWAGIHGFSILMLDGQFQGLTKKSDIELAIDSHLKFLERSFTK
ncbi:division inhibitor protein [compost metagenome]